MFAWMFRWSVRILAITFLGSLVYSGVQGYRGGYFQMPEMPPGSYAFSFKSGFRGILLNAQVTQPVSESMPNFFRRLNIAHPERRYWGIPFDVPVWMKEAWSTCASPNDEEQTYFAETMPEEWKSQLLHARLEAVCLVDVDWEKIARGLLYSIPAL
jgi:hypothetical protein